MTSPAELAPSGGIHVDGLTLDYPTRAGAIRAVESVSFSSAAGSFISLVGPSGCGKSTVLRVLADLEQPTAGQVTVLGQPPRAVRTQRRLGMALQDASLLPWRTVRANVELPLTVMRRTADPGWEEELIDLVGLTQFASAKPQQLSGGMRQRVAIARAFVTKPDLLLLDEPFGALDEITRRRLNIELQRLWTEHRMTTLLVTHSIAEAVFLSDQVVVMSAHPGRVAAIVDVPFPRPRREELLDSEDFLHLCAHVGRLLRDAEAVR